MTVSPDEEELQQLIDTFLSQLDELKELLRIDKLGEKDEGVEQRKRRIPFIPAWPLLSPFFPTLCTACLLIAVAVAFNSRVEAEEEAATAAAAWLDARRRG